MTKVSEEAAASRARSTADRLSELRLRLDRLKKGEPATAEDVQRARRQAKAQARALADARDRLLLMHRAAAARHEEHAERLARAGRTGSADRERSAAQRNHDTIERYLGTGTTRTSSGPDPGWHARSGADAGPLPVASPAAEEIARLRHALAALLSWAGEPGPDEVDRRQKWCRAIVGQCDAPGWRGWMHAVCLVAASALASVRGLAITVVSGSDAEFVVASDSWTSTVHELQLIVGEGPSVTAHADDRTVVVDDLATERGSWQGYASASFGHGLRGICALPLRVRGCCVGSLTLYHWRSVSEHAPMDLADAGAFADIAVAALPADIEELRHGDAAGDERFIVHIATGVIATRLNIPLREAESRLRAHAFSTGTSLVEAARQFVSGDA